MKINTFKNFIMDALKSLRRNKTISIASSLTVAATLCIFGIFMLVGLTVNKQVENIESKVEIVVFLNEGITYGDQRNVENKLSEIEGVSGIRFEGKGQALNKLKDQLGENKDLLDGYSENKNPMPTSFIVKIDGPEVAKEVENQTKDLKGVEQVRNQEDLINQISKISSSIKWTGVIVFMVLTSVSLFLIANTIKLTVFSRRREIGIMKFVGATDWFIRWPFIIEGVILGVLGALISNLILYFGYNVFYTKLTESLITSQLVSPSYIVTYMLLEFIVAGIFVGALGSTLSLRKFLDV